jgi:hypothetical protein
VKRGILVIVVLVGLVLCSLAANYVYDEKVSEVPYEANAPVQFYAGMDKFLSNVGWMTLIQWEAKGNLDTNRADDLYNKLNSLTNLDPLFADAYLDGAMAIMVSSPDHAAALLDKGVALGLQDNWKLQFYAGLIQFQYKHDLHQAEVHWGAARNLPNAPFFVQTAWMRSRSDQLGSDHLGAMDMWYSFYAGLNDTDSNQRLERKIAASYISDLGDQVESDCDGKLNSETDSKERALILEERAKAQKMLDTVKASSTTEPSSAQPSA